MAKSSFVRDGRRKWNLQEYPVAKTGAAQLFPDRDFAPTQDDFAEEALKEVRIQQLEDRIEKLEKELQKQKQKQEL
ncbi:hypothetical protein L0152_13920 [bacterium]|nr:hypothetical protein [bacterium]